MESLFISPINYRKISAKSQVACKPMHARLVPECRIVHKAIKLDDKRFVLTFINEFLRYQTIYASICKFIYTNELLM